MAALTDYHLDELSERWSISCLSARTRSEEQSSAGRDLGEATVQHKPLLMVHCARVLVFKNLRPEKPNDISNDSEGHSPRALLYFSGLIVVVPQNRFVVQLSSE